MYTRRFIAASIGLVLVASPAAADWQWTKWGMTPEEVLKSSNGKASLTDENEIKKWSPVQGVNGEMKIIYMALAKAPYDANGMNFRAVFLFSMEASKLECVDLTVNDVSHNAKLGTELERIYGAHDRIMSVPMIGFKMRSWDKEDEISLREGTGISAGPSSVRYCTRTKGGL